MKLYEISNKYLQTFNKLEQIDEVNDGIIENELSLVKDEFKNKVISVSSFIKNLEAEAIAIKQAEFDMAMRRRVLEKKIDSIKSYLLNNMERIGYTQINCPYFSIKVRTCPTSVEIVDSDKIPEGFMRIKKEPDKEKIKLFLNSGSNHIDIGAVLKRNKSLQIK